MVKVTISGNLVADPEYKTGDRSGVASARVAASTNTKDKDGNFVTNFYRISYWGTRGESFAKRAHKGDRVVAVGTLTVTPAISQKSGGAIAFLDVNADAIEIVTKAAAADDLDDEL